MGDLNPFEAAVRRVRAEQFFAEKNASVEVVSAVQAVHLDRLSGVQDPDLLKLAAAFCPEEPLAFYEKLGGKFDFKDPARKASGGVARFGEKLMGTRAKRLGNAIKGIDQDIKTTSGAVELARKAHVQNPGAGHGGKLKALSDNLSDLDTQRSKLHGELHGFDKRVSTPEKFPHQPGGTTDVTRHTPGELEKRDTARGQAAVGAAVGATALMLHRGDKKSKK